MAKRENEEGSFQFLPAWTRTTEVRRMARYLVAGGLTTVVNFGIFALLHGRLGWGENRSNVIAVICAVLFAYFINKWFVFHTRCSSVRELIREAFSFFAARGVTMVLEIGGVFLFVTWGGLPAYWTKLGITLVIVLLNYIFSKLFVFKGKDSAR